MITLASPFALTLLIAPVLLVLAYLKRKPENRQIVSTTLFLKQLRPRSTVRTRPKLPLRYFLEAMVLAGLALAAAGLGFINQTADTLVLIDNSLSMSANLFEDNTSRLSQALNRLEQLLTTDSSGKYQLYITSPKLTKLGENLSRSSLLESVKQVQPLQAEDFLADAMLELRQSVPRGRIAVVSDYESEGHDPLTELVAPPTTKLTVNNLALTNMTIAKESGDPLLVVTAKRFGQGRSKMRVRITYERYQPNNLMVGNLVKSVQAAEQLVTILPNHEETISFKLPSKFPEGLVLKAELIAENAADDSILLDNTRRISPESARQTVLFISPKQEQNALGLNNLPDLAIRQETPQGFDALDKTIVANAAVAIFLNAAPQSPPQIPTLLITPPSGPLLQLTELPAPPRISSWQTTHPLTRYLTVPLLTTNPAIIATTSAISSIINSERGSLLVAGEINGVRIAATSLTILPFEPTRRPAAAVLLLNTLAWLTNIENSNPNSNKLPGVYFDATTHKLDVTNYYSQRESDTTKLNQLSLAKIPTPHPTAVPPRSDLLVTFLISGALALLLIELILRVRAP